MSGPFPDGSVLPLVARDALLERFGRPRLALDVADELHALAACFVTLTQGGKLRGCVGTTTPTGPLVETVRRSAVAAALEDPRFPPIEADDLPGLAIEVSVLSELEPVPVVNRKAVLDAIEPARHGLLLRTGSAGATYLPQVWRHFERPEDFLDELLEKAGLRERWPRDLSAWRYEARTWSDDGPIE